MRSPRNKHATRCGVSSDSVLLMRSRSSMGLRGQVRSARTNSGIFAPGWFVSRTIAGCGEARCSAPCMESAAPLGREVGLGSTHKREGEAPMLRKMILVIAAMAAISGAVALSSTEASARWGGRGWGGGHSAFGSVGVGRVGGWGWRGAGWRGGGWGWRGARVAGLGWRGAGWGWRGARVAGLGWRGPGWGWRRAGWGWGGWGWGGVGLLGVGIPVAYSCWRWVPTGWGSARVWVC